MMYPGESSPLELTERRLTIVQNCCRLPDGIIADGWDVLEEQDLATRLSSNPETAAGLSRIGLSIEKGLGFGIGIVLAVLSDSSVDEAVANHFQFWVDEEEPWTVAREFGLRARQLVCRPADPLQWSIPTASHLAIREVAMPKLDLKNARERRIFAASAAFGYASGGYSYKHWKFDYALQHIADDLPDMDT